MAIISKITNSAEFVAEWMQWEQRQEQFSRPALEALFEYLDDLSDDIGEDIELDVVALCCDYSEYESLDAYCADYGAEFESLDDLRDHTEVIEFDGGIIVAAH